MDAMIDFFERTRISPKSEVMIGFIKFQNYMIGRFDYLEEILRTMEREQLRPTHDMLKSLFDGTAHKKKERPVLVDRKSIKMTKAEWNLKEGHVSFEKHHSVVKVKAENLRLFNRVFDHVTKIEPTFGKPYLKLEMSETELRHIKQQLNVK
jgi:aminopeptidase-like protein